MRSVIALSRSLGADPLLVQGAGGNLSWKDGGTLWIKASGTSLAHAAADTFVPVDREALSAVPLDGSDIVPEPLNGSAHRPSIETQMHAVLPQSVVIHLHAVDVLAPLVRADADREIRDILAGRVNYALVDYVRPGGPLAAAVASALAERETPPPTSCSSAIMGSSSVGPMQSMPSGDLSDS